MPGTSLMLRASSTAAAIAPTSMSVPASRKRGLPCFASASDVAASSISSAAMADRTMSTCCVRWVPSQTISSRLVLAAPTMAPSVLAA
jgi:hypothetical protein